MQTMRESLHTGEAEENLCKIYPTQWIHVKISPHLGFTAKASVLGVLTDNMEHDVSAHFILQVRGMRLTKENLIITTFSQRNRGSC